MDTDSFSEYVRGKLFSMLFRNKNRATQFFVVSDLSMKNPMHAYGPLSIFTHNSLITLFCVPTYAH